MYCLCLTLRLHLVETTFYQDITDYNYIWPSLDQLIKTNNKSIFVLSKPDVPSPMSNCSSLKCKTKFELPIKFKDFQLQIDLGRIVRLNVLFLKLDPIDLPENFTFPNFTLQFSNTLSLNASLTSCSFINQVNFTVKFNCRNKLGRVLTAKMIISKTGNFSNSTTSAGNFSSTENRLTSSSTKWGVANL